tara:strand:+ start:190 stop:1488 length:1299 start_codon:yes stop_codon:yes gene_type:complete
MINKTQYNGVTVVWRGDLPSNTPDFINDVCTGVKPRGNYGCVVILNDNERYYISDHFSSYPIWFTNNDYDWFYHDLVKRTNNLERDDSFFNERKMMGGFTVSLRTPYLNIRRVPTDAMIHVKNGETKIIKQETLIDDKLSTNSIEDIRTYFENLIEKNVAEKNVLFLSGGKDSTTLAHIIKKLGLEKKFKFVSLWSPKAKQHEKEPVTRIASQLQIDVQFVPIEYSGQIFDEETNKHFFSHWIENTYSAKRKAIFDLDISDHLCWSGEVGVGNMQSRYVLQYFAQKGFNIEAMAKFAVNICGSHRRIGSTKPDALKYLNSPEEYKRCYEYFEAQLRDNKHPDEINKLLFCRLKEESAFRVFAYNQDKELKWIHPYTDFKFINSCVNWTSSIKFISNKDKNIYRLLWPEMTTIPWEYAKSGLGIPAYSKYNTN